MNTRAVAVAILGCLVMGLLLDAPGHAAAQPNDIRANDIRANDIRANDIRANDIRANDKALPDLAATPTDKALLRRLRAGGLILYFRHGITDLSTEDTDREDLSHCATQRRLSEAGREQMRRIGAAFRTLEIRVSGVLSSPYCRSLETARLAFGDAEIDDDLRHTVTADEAQAARQAAALRRLLAIPPTVSGTNKVISGHTGNLQEATGIWPKPEGVAIVFQPDGNGGFDYVATVHPDQWEVFVRSRY